MLLLDVAKFLFSNKVIDEWDIQSENLKTTAGNSLGGFKRKLDRHLSDVRRFT